MQLRQLYHGISTRPAQRTQLNIIWAFLNSIQLVPVGSDQLGTSWIQLFCQYEYGGGRIIASDFSNSVAPPRTSLRALLIIFKQLVRHVISRTGSQETLALFAASKSKWPRLAGLGFSNHAPSISAWVARSTKYMNVIGIRLLTQKIKMNPDNRQQFLDGTLRAVPCELSMRGTLAWRNLPADYVLEPTHVYGKDLTGSLTPRETSLFPPSPSLPLRPLSTPGRPLPFPLSRLLAMSATANVMPPASPC